MKVAVIMAIALALSTVAVMAVQTVMALDVGPGASNFAPGKEFKGVPPNPILPGATQFSPGHLFHPGDPYRGNQFAPGQVAEVGTGPG